MTQLILLEDAHIRLEMFKLELAHVPFQITDDVMEFIELVQVAEAAGTLRMIVMDHDLGCAKDGGRRFNFDANGLSGTEAAEMLNTKVPVLVWSANFAGATRMVNTLRKKEIDAVYIPIYRTMNIVSVFQRVFPYGTSTS